MEFHFAFWNCAISPPGVKDKCTDENVAHAVEIIADLFFTKKISLLALCEVNSESFSSIKKSLDSIGLRLSAEFMPDKTDNGAEFDIGYFFDPNKVYVENGVAHTARLGTSIVKVAQQLLLVINNDVSNAINIFVSHWPSQLRTIAEDFRDECSKGLRRNVENFIFNSKQVILMGDYNDEPYSQSLFKNIHATNDRALVLSEPNYWLYNPFWKALSARTPFTFDENQHDLGTCYSKSGNRNNWSTFDQIIFSGLFLHTGPWYLKESETGVVLTDKLLAAIVDNKNFIDHMPVIGCICKRGEINVSF
ncbi:hypothetical protein [Enterobacter sichuanensis]|uniref:endonuclease/exonuclease/phosphatase family protein n=1 Tax=Enterobacter sichuanensis TaxID=2071710 RepID=UPI002075499A|nr:hypothetical protein [Enterobacter sichuanensis]MCM7883452.1 hypothetical protein [Enterobacter sichuanensis]